MRIIGIHGKAGSGKNTVGEFLSEQYRFVDFGFAEPLKEACIKAFGLDPYDVYTDHGKSSFNPFWNVTNRQILQFVGTELFRDHLGKLIPGVGSTFWLRRASLHIKDCEKNGYTNFAINDVRFENEIEWILSHPGSIVIHLVRDVAGAKGGIVGHSSEADLDLSKYGDKIVRIENNEAFFDLYARVTKVVHSFKFI